MHSIQSITVTVQPGTHIRDAIKDAKMLADEYGTLVTLTFQGKPFRVNPYSLLDYLIDAFWGARETSSGE